jgi:hypothetical protein
MPALPISFFVAVHSEETPLITRPLSQCQRDVGGAKEVGKGVEKEEEEEEAEEEDEEAEGEGDKEGPAVGGDGDGTAYPARATNSST